MTTRGKHYAALAAMAIAVAIVFHAPLLRGSANLLVSSPAPDEADYIGILDWWNTPDGDRAYEAAASLFDEKKTKNARRGFLVVEFQPGRLSQIGVLPTFEELSRRELGARGVPQQKISILRAGECGDWNAARAIGGWLRDRPNATLLLLCSQFRSEQLRRTLDRALDPALAARVRVRPLPDRRYDATNWWKSRRGFRAFGFAWLIRIHGWWYGDTSARPPRAATEDYERHFLRTINSGAGTAPSSQP